MTKIAEGTKHSRLNRIFLLLQRHENGLTEREIAEQLGFEGRTTNNYLRQLEMEGKIYKDRKYWFADTLPRLKLRDPELEPEQAMMLYLASRLFVKQSDRRNESAETALLKLAHVLGRDAGLGDDLYQAAEELARRPEDSQYQDIFQIVMRDISTGGNAKCF